MNTSSLLGSTLRSGTAALGSWSLGQDVLSGGNALFPVLAVEFDVLDVLGRRQVEASRVHAEETGGMRTGPVERHDSADRAEGVVGDAGAESVGLEELLAPMQPEPLLGHHQLLVAGLVADPAVTQRDGQVAAGGRRELHATAVAFPVVPDPLDRVVELG